MHCPKNFIRNFLIVLRNEKHLAEFIDNQSAMSPLYEQTNSQLADVDIALPIFLWPLSSDLNEPPHGKTNNLHRRKQRRRSASR